MEKDRKVEFTTWEKERISDLEDQVEKLYEYLNLHEYDTLPRKKGLLERLFKR